MDTFARSPNKNPGIKRTFYPLPVERPDDFRCIKLQIPDGDEYFELLITALKSLTLWYSYDRDPLHQGKVIADMFRDAFLLPGMGCDMDCAELLACIGPLFDPLYEKLDNQAAALAGLIENINRVIDTNRAKRVTAAGDCDAPDAIYGAALEVVRKIHRDNLSIFAASESSIPGTLVESTEFLVALFPNWATLPFAALAELVNSYFEGQVTAYEDAYNDENFEQLAAGDLYCFVTRNGCEINEAIFAAWFTNITKLVPDNAAAVLYGRHAPIAFTFINQIAAALTGAQSLESYFKSLVVAFEAGLTTPATVPENACAEQCNRFIDYITQPPGLLVDVGTLDEAGFIDSVTFNAGGPDTAWIIAGWDPFEVILMASARLVYSDGLPKAWELYTDTVAYTGLTTPAYIGAGEFAIDVVIDPPLTGNLIAVNTRQDPTGDTAPFKLLRIELCED